jgi:hypothetical protein
VKLRELKEARNDVIASNAKKIFIKTFVKQMSSALGRAVQSGTVDSPVAAPAAPSAPETPEQKRIRLQRAAQQNADQTGASFSRIPAATPKTPEQIRQEKQAAAAQAAQQGMTPAPTQSTSATSNPSPEDVINPKYTPGPIPNGFTQINLSRPGVDPQVRYVHTSQLQSWLDNGWKQGAITGSDAGTTTGPAKPAVWRSGRNPTGPATTTIENKKFDKLNRLFESIINIDEDDQATPNKKSLSDLIIEYFVKDLNRPEIFTPSNPEIWNQIKAKADAIAKSYPNMSAGLEDLANFGWDTANSTKATGTQQVATPPNATGSQQATGQSGETAAPAEVQQSKVGVRQINKLIPTLRKRDLLSVKKNVDNTLAGRGGSATAAPTPGNSAFGQMANQLSSPKTSTSSTGGTTTTTPTGKVHTAAKTRVPSQTTETPPAAKNNVVKMPKGKVRAAKEGGVTPEEQAKFDEKVRQAMAAQSK